MQHNILHLTARFSLNNLKDLDSVSEMDKRSIKEYIQKIFPSWQTEKVCFTHNERRKKDETVFTFESNYTYVIKEFLRNIDENLKDSFLLGVRISDELSIKNQDNMYLNVHEKEYINLLHQSEVKYNN